MKNFEGNYLRINKMGINLISLAYYDLDMQIQLEKYNTISENHFITGTKNNSNNLENFNIMKLEHNLDISINCPDKIPKISYTKSFSVEYIIKNKYFSLCENIEDISLTLSPILQDTNNISINEEINGVNLKIKLPHPKCPEIIFFFVLDVLSLYEGLFSFVQFELFLVLFALELICYFFVQIFF